MALSDCVTAGIPTTMGRAVYNVGTLNRAGAAR
jgi:hypothetical protein